MKDYEVEIAILRKQHKEQETAVAKYQRLPGHCNVQLTKMKAEKLRVKEQIALLEKEQAAQPPFERPELTVVESSDDSVVPKRPTVQHDAAAA
jgi:hypothetical protein